MKRLNLAPLARDGQAKLWMINQKMVSVLPVFTSTVILPLEDATQLVIASDPNDWKKGIDTPGKVPAGQLIVQCPGELWVTVKPLPTVVPLLAT